MAIEDMVKEHGTPDKLEYYAFMWSLARMVLAAVALLLGGVPVVYKILGYSAYSTVGSLLNLAWVISGVAAGYLLYMWFKNDKRVFGGSEQKDTVAFFVMIVSGFNLGLAGLDAGNIGLNMFRGDVFLYIGAAIYIVATYYLYTRWVSNGRQLFAKGGVRGALGTGAAGGSDQSTNGNSNTAA